MTRSIGFCETEFIGDAVILCQHSDDSIIPAESDEITPIATERVPSSTLSIGLDLLRDFLYSSYIPIKAGFGIAKSITNRNLLYTEQMLNQHAESLPLLNAPLRIMSVCTKVARTASEKGLAMSEVIAINSLEATDHLLEYSGAQRGSSIKIFQQFIDSYESNSEEKETRNAVLSIMRIILSVIPLIADGQTDTFQSLLKGTYRMVELQETMHHKRKQLYDLATSKEPSNHVFKKVFNSMKHKKKKKRECKNHSHQDLTKSFTGAVSTDPIQTGDDDTEDEDVELLLTSEIKAYILEKQLAVRPTNFSKEMIEKLIHYMRFCAGAYGLHLNGVLGVLRTSYLNKIHMSKKYASFYDFYNGGTSEDKWFNLSNLNPNSFTCNDSPAVTQKSSVKVPMPIEKVSKNKEDSNTKNFMRLDPHYFNSIEKTVNEARKTSTPAIHLVNELPKSKGSRGYSSGNKKKLFSDEGPKKFKTTTNFAVTDDDAMKLIAGIEDEDMLHSNTESHMYIPTYYIIRDTSKKKIVIAISGTSSYKDVIVDLVCELADFSGIHDRFDSKVTGKVHKGFLIAAQRLCAELHSQVHEYLNENQDYGLVITGHSLGAGISTIMTLMWAQVEYFNRKGIICYAFGSPSTVCAQLANSPFTKRHVVSLVCGNDFVSRLSLPNVIDVFKTIKILRNMGEMEYKAYIKHVKSLGCKKTYVDYQSGLYQKLFPAGKVFLYGQNEFSNDVVEVDPTRVFQSILLKGDMVKIHMTKFYLDHLLTQL